MPTYTRPGVQRFRSRLTVSDEVEGLCISIPPPRDWAILGIVVWLGFWTFAGLHQWRNLIQRSPLFLVVWAFGELWGSFAVLDNIGGREIILANSETLTRTRKILALGWSKPYPVHEIRNLRFQRSLGRQPSRIAFDYGARTITFGKCVEEAEACDLMRRIRQRCAIADDSAKQESGIRI
jgi:hypothetical protein